MAGSWYILYVNGRHWRDEYYFEGEVHEWSVHEDAQKGDYGLLYAIAPVKAFVAICQIQETAVKTASEPVFHANHEGWAETEILEELEGPLEYQSFGRNTKLRTVWPLVKSQMQPSKGPEKIPGAAIEILAELIPELDDFLHNPENEHRSGRRFIWQVMDQSGKPIEGAWFDSEQEAKSYTDQHRDYRGRPFWIKREIQ